MKYIFSIITSLLLLTVFTFVQVHAQEEDEGVVFEVETTFTGDQSAVKEAKTSTFELPASQKRTLKSPPPAILKKLKLPKGVKVLPAPITLKRNGNCYKFGCQKGEDCENCRMLWLDRNKDGKIQPRKELRCACPDGGKCRIRVRKVDCK